MKRSKCHLPLTPLILLLLLPRCGMATQIMMQPWQVLVANAELVGIIECVTAGEVVARYRILESWKGPPAGTEVLVRGATSVWEPTLPIAMVGDRLLVAASMPKSRRVVLSYASMSAGPGDYIPAWWRDERPDFVIPTLLHFAVLFPISGRPTPTHLLGQYDRGMASFRRDVRRLLALSDDCREAAVLRALIQWHIMRGKHRFSEPFTESDRVLEERTRSANVDSVVSALLDFARRNRTIDSQAMQIFGMGGGRHSLKSLSTLPEATSRGSLVASEISYIRRRLGLEDSQEPLPTEIGRPPAETLDAMRGQLRLIPINGRDSESYLDARNRKKAFELLTVFDPAFVAEYLREWQCVDDGFSGEVQGYGLGSYFGWKCAGDRVSFLRTLTRAKDPYVRVAGAIYLCFEDETAGMIALREMAKTPGDPGTWAALNLARRGDKEAARRALQVFETTAGGSISTRVHMNLQKRLVVLFSNSAKRSRVPQPPKWTFADEDDQFQVYSGYITWWNQNQSRLKLWDPWLTDLTRKKIE